MSAEHVGSKMNSKNSELHRRPHFGVSFVAASVRALVKMLCPLPLNLSKALSPDDNNSIVWNVRNVRTMLQTQQGKDVVAACDLLDNGNGVTRNPAVLRPSMKKFFMFIAQTDQFLPAVKRYVMHGSTLVVAGAWILMCRAAVQDPDQWAGNFGDAQVRAKSPVPLRQWLRNPGDKRALIEGVAALSESRRAGDVVQSRTASLEDMDDDEGALVPRAPARRETHVVDVGPLLEDWDVPEHSGWGDDDTAWDNSAPAAVGDWDDIEDAPVRGTRRPALKTSAAPARKKAKTLGRAVVTEEDDLEELEACAGTAFSEWDKGDAEMLQVSVLSGMDNLGTRGRH